MSHIIDKRKNGKNKSAPNRERFVRRYKSNVKEAVKDAINNHGIADINKDKTDIRVKRKELTEPWFSNDHDTGNRTNVRPGNKEFVSGDRLRKPPPGQGGGNGSEGSDNPDTSEDDFIFSINKEEFLDIFFEDLELPNMIRTSLKNATEFISRRAGYSTVGNPANLNVVKSIEKSIGRRVALRSPLKKKVKTLKGLLVIAEAMPDNEEEIVALKEQIVKLESRIKAVPYIDDFDLRFNAHTKER